MSLACMPEHALKCTPCSAADSWSLCTACTQHMCMRANVDRKHAPLDRQRYEDEGQQDQLRQEGDRALNKPTLALRKAQHGAPSREQRPPFPRQPYFVQLPLMAKSSISWPIQWNLNFFIDCQSAHAVCMHRNCLTVCLPLLWSVHACVCACVADYYAISHSHDGSKQGRKQGGRSCT